MNSDSAPSSLWLQQLVDGEPDVVASFIAQYGPAIERIAANRISPALGQRVGADDVFQSVCRTFFRRAQSGQFTFPDRESLWRLLCAITLNKVRNQARFHKAQKRGTGQEVGSEATAMQPSGEASPEEAAEFADEIAHLISGLGETESRVVQMKMEGHSHADIANELNCTVRTVGRLLVKVRNRLEEQMPGSDS